MFAIFLKIVSWFVSSNILIYLFILVWSVKFAKPTLFWGGLLRMCLYSCKKCHESHHWLNIERYLLQLLIWEYQGRNYMYISSFCSKIFHIYYYYELYMVLRSFNFSQKILTIIHENQKKKQNKKTELLHEQKTCTKNTQNKT